LEDPLRPTGTSPVKGEAMRDDWREGQRRGSGKTAVRKQGGRGKEEAAGNRCALTDRRDRRERRAVRRGA